VRSVETNFFCLTAKEKLEIVKSRGGAVPNSQVAPRRRRRRNAFGLIQVSCTRAKLKSHAFSAAWRLIFPEHISKALFRYTTPRVLSERCLTPTPEYPEDI
jgi:hypothetical protein